MHSKVPEMQGRQKVVRPSTYRLENEYNPEAMPQYFQISVNVLEGQKFSWANPQSANSYVIIELGKQKRRTSIRRNMENPYYRETFVFELYTTILNLQQSSIWLAVMEPRCCSTPRLLGETRIDLGSIWAQPHHQVFHKWAQLGVSRHTGTGPVGFLKVDISVIVRGEIQVMPPMLGDDKLEENILLPTGSEQQCANYLVTVYGALGLPNGVQYQGDKRNGKAPNTFLKVTFCGLVAKTAIQYRTNNPMYCEQISIVEMFPNMNQMVNFEIFSTEACVNKVIASTFLNLFDISHDGDNGFLPTFGPSLIHMYGSVGSGSSEMGTNEDSYYRGSLLIALNTIVPYYQRGFRTVSVDSVANIKPENLWVLEDFCIFCPIFEVSMLDRKIAGKCCGVAITICEIPGRNKNDKEFIAIAEEIKARKLYYTNCLNLKKTQPDYGYLEFNNKLPVLQLTTRLPDFRYRIYRNNMLIRIVIDMEAAITKAEKQLKNFNYTSTNDLINELNVAMNNAATKVKKFIDLVHYTGLATSGTDIVMQHYSTELDQKQLALQKEEIDKIFHQISNKIRSQTILSDRKTTQNTAKSSRKTVKQLLADIKLIAQDLRTLIHKNYEGWPDIVIWLLNGGSRVAYKKISAADIIYSVMLEQCGKDCGRIQSIYFKPLKCPKHRNTAITSCCCIAGKVELLFWMGLYSQRFSFEACVPEEYKLKMKDYDLYMTAPTLMIECVAYIYKAKLNNYFINCNSAQLFARINILNAVKDTKVKQKTVTPVWNQTVRIHKTIHMTSPRLLKSPPSVMIEVINNDLSGKTETVGRFEIMPMMSDQEGTENVPKLQWYDLYRGLENTGKVLMSVKLSQIPEQLLKSTIYTPAVEEIVFASNFETTDEVVPIPSSLLPVSSCYKVDVYWWGLREVNITRKPCVVLEIDELTVKSDVVKEKKSNCNFHNGRTSHIFEAPLDAYNPSINIKLYDSSTFGRSLFLGTSVVKNPIKYIMDWLPKSDRDATLKRSSITSSDFIRVNQVLFVKRSSQLEDESGSYKSRTSIKSSVANFQPNRRKWRALFSKKELDEEKFTLLPVFKNAKCNKIQLRQKQKIEPKDWWFRYLRSQDHMSTDELCPGDFKIYESELESQPEFSKFKDWCSTLKLYSGVKSGVKEKDEQLLCGYLKAGLAIYKWPPSTNTIAVSTSGVDLNKGFFNEYASNDPAKFLVRVYLVKATNLKTKDFTGKSNPYVILSCGKKQLGNRNSYRTNTLNPIIGKMLEFWCNLPEDYLLNISLYNYDPISLDELIGSTTIDLEDRIYTKHRARVGITSEYSLSGPGKWRDYVKPSFILEEICYKNHMPPPIFPDFSTVIINGIEYKDSDNEKYVTYSERKENLCLSILLKWYTLPICGYHLVPEHVETRSLQNPDKIGVEQGKLQMWVDIFPLDIGTYIPPPVDITPKKVEDYEFRLTIYCVKWMNVNPENKCLIQKPIDVYVKAWIGSPDQAQSTDVHYQCATSEANFNWRMIFNFQYQHAFKKLIKKENEPFIEYEENVSPILIVQIIDNEFSCSDEFLGILVLDLNNMPRGVKRAQECTFENYEKSKKTNLFSYRNIKAWWPLQHLDVITGNNVLIGAIKMEMCLLPQDKAILMPVGVGRDPPFPLPDPVRGEGFRGFYTASTKNVHCCGRRSFLIIIILSVIICLIFTYIFYDFPSILIEHWIFV